MDVRCENTIRTISSNAAIQRQTPIGIVNKTTENSCRHLWLVPIHLQTIFDASSSFRIIVKLLLINVAQEMKDYLYLGHPDNEKGYVQELGSSENEELLPTFLLNNLVESRFVVFYAPWCPHCIHYAPEYIRIAHEITDEVPGIKFFAVSCTAHKTLCKNEKVTSYPTILAIRAGANVTSAIKVERNRSAQNLLDALNKTTTISNEKKKKHQNFREVKNSERNMSVSTQNIAAQNVKARSTMRPIFALSMLSLALIFLNMIPRIKRRRSGQHKKKDLLAV